MKLVVGRSAQAGRPTEQVTIASTSAEVEAIRHVWESLPVPNLDANIDYFSTVVRHLPGVIAPHVIRIERSGHAPLVIVARLEMHSFPVTIGYKRVVDPQLRTIVVAFDGVLGAQSADDLRSCVRALRSSLDGGLADAVVFQKITLGSPLHAAVVAGSSRILRIHGFATTKRWLLDLPDSLGTLLDRRSSRAGKKARAEERIIQRDHDDLRLVRLDGEGLERVQADLETVAGKTYQRGLGVGASTSDLGTALTALALDHGWLRVWMLYLQGVPVAFWWGKLHEGTFAADTPGFDPAYSKYHVGNFVMHAMIDELCRDPEAHTLDFGNGDARYKERYSTHFLDQTDVVILAPRLRPLAVGMVVSTLFTARQLGYRLVYNSRFADRIRRSSRSRLAAPENSD